MAETVSIRPASRHRGRIIFVPFHWRIEAYRRLNELLREHEFDDFIEAQCAGFLAATTYGRAALGLPSDNPTL